DDTDLAPRRTECGQGGGAESKIGEAAGWYSLRIANQTRRQFDRHVLHRLRGRVDTPRSDDFVNEEAGLRGCRVRTCLGGGFAIGLKSSSIEARDVEGRRSVRGNQERCRQDKNQASAEPFRIAVTTSHGVVLRLCLAVRWFWRW